MASVTRTIYSQIPTYQMMEMNINQFLKETVGLKSRTENKGRTLGNKVFRQHLDVETERIIKIITLK